MGKNPLSKSFSCAFSGIVRIVKKERNIKIELACALLAIILGLILAISRLEWLVLVLIIGVVLSAEILNSALEAVCNLLKDKLNLGYEETRFIRDASAGAVLLLAIGSIFIGFLIFFPKIVEGWF